MGFIFSCCDFEEDECICDLKGWMYEENEIWERGGWNFDAANSAQQRYGFFLSN